MIRGCGGRAPRDWGHARRPSLRLRRSLRLHPLHRRPRRRGGGRGAHAVPHRGRARSPRTTGCGSTKWLGDGAMFVSTEATAPGRAHPRADAPHRRARGARCRCGPGMAGGAVILFEGDDYVGGPVNLAARLCDVGRSPTSSSRCAELGACVPPDAAARPDGRARRSPASCSRSTSCASEASPGHREPVAGNACHGRVTDFEHDRVRDDPLRARRARRPARPQPPRQAQLVHARRCGARCAQLGRALLADPGDIRALVVVGEGRAFSSGIDTSVFAAGAAATAVAASSPPTSPSLRMPTRRSPGSSPPRTRTPGSTRRRSRRSPRSAATRSVAASSSRSRATSGSSRTARSSACSSSSTGSSPTSAGRSGCRASSARARPRS